MADPPSVLDAYRALLGAQLRGQWQYRTSFATDVLGSMTVALADLAEVYVVFHNVDVLGGLDWRGALLVFGLSQFGFALANLVAGTLDTMPTYLRTGQLDAMLLRPLPLLGQLMVGDVRLRRVGSAAVGAVALAVALAVQDVDWTPARAALLALMPLTTALVFVALFVLAGAVQFWLVDGADVTHAFTYASSYASRFSPAVLPVPLRLTFSFVFPAAFAGYLPALALLGLPGPALLPAWLGWAAPAVAVGFCGVTLGMWRLGVRHYTGAGG